MRRHRRRAAIFKAPATGMVFALEVPYREDLARRMLLPAMYAAATSYVVYVAINGTSVLLPVNGAPPFDFRDLVGAAALGLACGGGANCSPKVFSPQGHGLETTRSLRVLAFGSSIALLFVAGRLLTGESLVVGPGYSTIGWALQPNARLAVIVAVFFVRGLATICAVAGGGRAACSSLWSSKARCSAARCAHWCTRSRRTRRCSPCSASPRFSVPATECHSPRSCSSPNPRDAPVSSCRG